METETKPDVHDIIVAIFNRAGYYEYYRSKVDEILRSDLVPRRHLYEADRLSGLADYLAQLVLGGALIPVGNNRYRPAQSVTGHYGSNKHWDLPEDMRRMVDCIAKRFRDEAKAL